MDAAGLSPDAFLGHYRKDVKTSIWRKDGAIDPPEAIGDLGLLLDGLLPDQAMIEKYPDLEVSPQATDEEKLAAPATRFPEEQRNVAVRVWIWYVRKEADNDFHVVIGSTADTTARFMTVEVSGLPDEGSPDFEVLQQVRAQLLDLVGQEPNSKRYEALTPPLPVRVAGSLLFDGDHRAGEVGPTGHHPQTVWEIHPVIALEKRG